MNIKTPTIKGKIFKTIDVVCVDLTEDDLFELIKSPFLNIGNQTYITPRYQILECLYGSKTTTVKLKLTRI